MTLAHRRSHFRIALDATSKACSRTTVKEANSKSTQLFVQLLQSVDKMMCIHCCAPVQELYNGQANNIRLTRCPKCENICDKYIEYEQPLIFLDIALQRVETHRHILFNSLAFQSSPLWLLALLAAAAAGRTVLAFFESFVWQVNGGDGAVVAYVVHRPLPAPAFSWLICAFFKQLLWLLVRWAIQSRCALRVAAASGGRMRRLSFRQLVHALSMSSYGYTIYLLMMAWDYDSRIHIVVSTFVFISNAVAVHAAIECGALWAIAITLPPMFVGWLFDSYVGLGFQVPV